MHKDYYCAYHHTQIITSFCRCRDCLLPTCATCLKLHNQQHSLNKTAPQYQSMGMIFKQITSQLKYFQNQTKSLTNSLLIIQKKRKNEMNQIRKIINIKTQQIIAIIQQSLKDLDRRIINKIYQMDSDFIKQIEGLDNQILDIQNQIQRYRCGLESQQSLKTVISYFQVNKKQQIAKSIDILQQKINKFAKKRLETFFLNENDFKNVIHDVMTKFIQINERIEAY